MDNNNTDNMVLENKENSKSNLIMSPMNTFRSEIKKMESEIKAVLPPQIPVEKFIRVTLTSVSLDPKLLECDRKSLFSSCMKAAQDGLLCDGREAALVIFKDQVQYMPMYAGIFKKIRNSGELASVSSNVVHKNDEFYYELGDDEKIIHKPLLDGDRGNPIAAYSIAKTKDGAVFREVMSHSEIEQVRQVSRSGNSPYSPWAKWWDEMAKKTVFRRLAKRLPISTDVENVFNHDNENFDFNNFSLSKNNAVYPINAKNRLALAMGLEK